MDTLNNIQRMTNVIEDKHETAIPSKYVWRQARAMEAIDKHNLIISRDFETGMITCLPVQSGEMIKRMSTRVFNSAFDAVEFFLKTLEEVKVAK